MKNPLAFTDKIPLLEPFQYRNYRIFMIGVLGSITGHQIQNFTILWFVYEITGSPLYLGLTGGTLAISTILFSTFGGVLADRFDRRVLLFITQCSLGFIIFTLATLIVLKMATVWHVLTISFLSGTVQAFDRPARESLVPHLVDNKKDLLNAIALYSVVWQMTRIIGPAIAGIIIGFAGAALAFYISSFLYFGLIIAALKLRFQERIKPGGENNMWRSLMEGLSYIYKSPVFSAIISMAFVNGIFGLSYLFLIPAFTKDILKVGPEGYGFIMTAIGIGGLLGSLTPAILGHAREKYGLFIGSSLVSGLFIILFAHSQVYSFSLILAGLAALATNIYMVIGQTFLQTLVPDHLRGRITGTYGLVWSLIPLGSLQSGAIATYLGAPAAVTIGAFVLIGCSLFILAFVPSLRKIKV